MCKMDISIMFQSKISQNLVEIKTTFSTVQLIDSVMLADLPMGFPEPSPSYIGMN